MMMVVVVVVAWRRWRRGCSREISNQWPLQTTRTLQTSAFQNIPELRLYTFSSFYLIDGEN